MGSVNKISKKSKQTQIRAHHVPGFSLERAHSHVRVIAAALQQVHLLYIHCLILCKMHPSPVHAYVYM